MLPRDAYERPKPMADLFARIDVLTAKLGDPLLAAFDATEHLSPQQAEQLYEIVWGEGAPLQGGGLGFSARECDVLQLLAARLQKPLRWAAWAAPAPARPKPPPPAATHRCRQSPVSCRAAGRAKPNSTHRGRGRKPRPF